MSFRKNPPSQSPRSNSNGLANRRQSADVIKPSNRLTNRRQSADNVSLTTGWRSVDCIGLYQSALSHKSPEEDHSKTVQIVQVCAVNKEHLDNIIMGLESILGSFLTA